jgi:glyoxylase-like metal-dependent hydrolase (beta-lactamase superfamily II)
MQIPKVSLTIVLLFLLATACAQSANSYEKLKVADGIYAFIAPEGKTGFVSSNQTAIIGDDGVLIFDTGQIPSLSEKIIAEIKQITPLPVKYIVISHWHYDHVVGAATYLKAFPNAILISSDATREQIVAKAKEFGPQATLKTLPDYLKSQQDLLAAGKLPDGTPLTPEQKEYLQLTIADVQAARPHIEAAKVLEPTLTMSQSLTIHLGKRAVEVKFMGRGNTDGDTIAYIPDAKVLLTGDLVVAPTPYGILSYYDEWISTLDRLAAIDATTFIPGHGAIQKDFSYVRMEQDLLRATISRVDDAVKRGLTLEQTQKEVTLEDFRDRLAGNDHWRKRNFRNYWVFPAVQRLYEMKKGFAATPK